MGAERATFPYYYAPPAYIRSEYVGNEFDEGAEQGEMGGGGGEKVIAEYADEYGKNKGSLTD